jgi:hypothetical protein
MNRDNFSYSPWISYLTGIVTLSLLLTSCMMHEKYPSSWGDLIPVDKNKCPDISGIYMNTGGKSALTHILGLKDTVGETHVTHVQITQLKDGTLEISGWDMVGDEKKLVDKKSYPKRKYSCTSDGIRASSHIEGGIVPEGLGGFGAEFDSYYLTKNTDGDLVAKETGTAIGFSWIIPAIGFGTNWYRFPHEDLKKE